MSPSELIRKIKNRVGRELEARMRYIAHERKERELVEHIRDHEPGSIPWLIATERHYGGYASGIKRGKVSKHDPRTSAQIEQGGMIGGDRMSAVHHSYASEYSRHILPFVSTKPKSVLVEAGILRGTGLAIWSDLFPDGRIIGLDVDLGHIQQNMGNLKGRGAFSNDNLELHTFDQLEDNKRLLGEILGEDKVDIYIDDGLHSKESIMTSLASIRPYLANNCVCFIEDNDEIAPSISADYPEFQIESHGMLTVMWMTQ